MKGQVESTVRNFLERLGYTQPAVSTEMGRRLKDALLDDYAYFKDHPRPAEWFDKTCTLCIALSQASIPQASDIFAVYFDDMTHVMPESLKAFQKKFMMNDMDLDVMVTFRRILSDAYRLWDDIPANLIVNATMEFVTGCAMEGDVGIGSMKVQDTAKSWPDFLRAKTGISPAYSFMVFPLRSSLPSYIQVIGDTCRFIELTNDVLSFYKEYLAGETQNYISNRALTTERSPLQAFQDVAEQVLSTNDRICATLKEPELTSWNTFVNGYLAFHVTQERYLLDKVLLPGQCGIVELP
ncbi:hypothetical protein VNI00_007890 [Paramarasmius palmivorus]|uniref:Terpene synthase n=1 Tax=Paramarasmius palmivorus TaxID=297713 RepID=A0AAW0CZF1_9AGAR